MPHSNIPDLAAYLSACKEDYARCLDVLPVSIEIDGAPITFRFHYLKFTPDGVPMCDTLAECLAKHVVDYCLFARRRADIESLGYNREYMIREACGLFRKHPRSGEAGELLLYFLQETVLNAPQLVAKMSLKDNPHAEVLGSDGIHGAWDSSSQILTLYFGESKLYQNISAAMSEAFKSLKQFHENGLLQHETPMVTTHFKYLDEDARRALLKHIGGGSGTAGIKYCHTLLIGYDWNLFNKLDRTAPAELLQTFLVAYREKALDWANLLKGHWNTFPRQDLGFEVFFLPFRSVQELRDVVILKLKELS